MKFIMMLLLVVFLFTACNEEIFTYTLIKSGKVSKIDYKHTASFSRTIFKTFLYFEDGSTVVLDGHQNVLNTKIFLYHKHSSMFGNFQNPEIYYKEIPLKATNR